MRTIRVLTVCTGNICRSPAAERLLRETLGEDGTVTVTSAGTHALVGHDIARPIAARLEELGSDAASFEARQLTPEMVRGADLVLGMAREHRAEAVTLHPRSVRRAFTLRQLARLVSLIEPAELSSLRSDTTTAARLDHLVTMAIARRGQEFYDPAEDDILDPWGGDAAGYTASLDQIRSAIDTLAAALRTR